MNNDTTLYGINSKHVIDVPLIKTNDVEVSMQLLDFQPDVCVVHCEVQNWSFGKYKEFIDMWSEIIVALRDKGFKKVLALIKQDDDGKNEHFCEMFGFMYIASYPDVELDEVRILGLEL